MVCRFFRPPIISDENVSGYTGKAADIIKLRVTGDVLVTGAFISIDKNDSTLTEKTDALIESNGPNCTYTTTAYNANKKGNVVALLATGLPDNLTKTQITLKQLCSKLSRTLAEHQSKLKRRESRRQDDR